MKRRIIAAAVSILLAVSFVLNLPLPATADTWDETIAHYDRVFAVIDGEPEMKFPELYTALLLNPDMFVSQLAFRDKEIKEYALQVLTGDWVSPEQWLNIKDALDSAETDFEAEKLLVRDIKNYRSYLSYQDVGIVTDCKALFDQVLTADGFYATDLAYDLAYAFIGTPETFILELSEEEKDVQDRAFLLLQEHQYSFLGAKIYESIPEYTGTDPNVINIISVLTSTTENHPSIYPQEDPDPSEWKQWLDAGYQPSTSTYYDYDRLFDFSQATHADTLAEALLNDTANFVNELAFRDMETKNQVISAFAGANFSDIYLIQMRYNLVSYHQSVSLTKSENDLLEVMIFSLESLYLSRPHAHRDCGTLFAEAIHVPAERQEAFSFEIINAFLDSPKDFIVHLAKETDAVQEAVISYLIVSGQKSASLQAVAIQIQRECNRSPDHYTEEEAQLLAEMKHQLPAVIYGPSFIDPDPDEYQQWLKDKGLLVDDPGMTLPIYPHPTQPEPTETAAVEETQPTAGEDPEKDTGWVSTVCFTLGFLCIGVAAGSMIAKKKKAKKAAQAEKQAAAEVPVKIYPKLLYCPAPLSRESQKQISQVLREKYDEYSVHWYSIKQPDGTCRCYGTEGGYDILFYAGGLRMEIPASCTVGECAFLFETSFELYAHKDGQLTDLNTALEQGLVSHQAVQEALDKHNSISR